MPASLKQAGNGPGERPQIFQVLPEDAVEPRGIHPGVHVHEQVPESRHGLQAFSESRFDKARISERVKARGVRSGTCLRCFADTW